MRLTARDLDEMMTHLYGRRWQIIFARLLKKNPTTINRWATGKIEIPEWVSVLAWALTKLKAQGIVIPHDFLEASDKDVDGDQ